MTRSAVPDITTSTYLNEKSDGFQDVIELNGVDAFIFDMDGVITDTANLHAATWKQLFDEYLNKISERSNKELPPFDINSEYLSYIDGKPRYDGVKSFLESRGIILPYGSPGDGIDQETICGLGNRKKARPHYSGYRYA